MYNVKLKRSIMILIAWEMLTLIALFIISLISGFFFFCVNWESDFRDRWFPGIY